MALLSQAEYARQRGITRQAVRLRTVDCGGPIPTHGRAKQIDPDEADRLWRATMQPAAAAQSRFAGPPEPTADAAAPGAAAALATVHALTKARTAALEVEADLRRLRLAERRGLIVDREAATRKAFAFAQLIRDAWQTWPARAGPQLAAQFALDPTAVTVALEEAVRVQLEHLSSERVAF